LNKFDRMSRFFIELSFKGTRYHGWQIQPNANTVQAELEKGLATLSGQPVETTGAGRTDAGVHGHHYVAHFDCELKLQEADLVYKLNAILPADIAIHSVFKVNPEAHARFTAISRSYKYRLTRLKDPFFPDISLYYPYEVNVSLMNEVAATLKSYTDFTSFSKLHSDVKTNNCMIYEAEWREEENYLVFNIKADRFLRNMVRSIVGTLLDIGRGKLAPQELEKIIKGKNRSLAGPSVPAHGLMLWGVEYPFGLRV
jgi:tRNA pseudouridine38-40 synthase